MTIIVHVIIRYDSCDILLISPKSNCWQDIIRTCKCWFNKCLCTGYWAFIYSIVAQGDLVWLYKNLLLSVLTGIKTGARQWL